MKLTTTEEQRKALREIFLEPEFPPIPPEVKAKIDEANRRRHQLEMKVWEHMKSCKMKDLSGNLITPETHEICYDMEPREIDGQHFMVSKQMYIQPKKSEWE